MNQVSLQFSKEELNFILQVFDIAVKSAGLNISMPLTPVIQKLGVALQQISQAQEAESKKNEQKAETETPTKA